MIGELFTIVAGSNDVHVVATLMIKSTLVTSVGLGIWLMLKRAPAAARHLVLRATIVAILILPAIVSLGPTFELFVLNTAESQDAQTSFVHQSAPATSGVAASAEHATAKSSVVTESRPGMSLFLMSYFLVTSALLAQLALGVLRIWWISRSAVEVTRTAMWWPLLDQIEIRRTRVLLTDQLTAPLTWGVIRPVVLIPRAAEHWSDQDKKNALQHEFAHIDRGDWLMQMIAKLVSAVYWFNPLVWITQRQLVLEAELAADDHVLRCGAIPDDYAEQLVTLAKISRDTRLTLAATTMANQSMLSQRVNSILDFGGQTLNLNQSGKYALICTVAITTLSVGSVDLVAAPQHNMSDTASVFPETLSTPLIRAAAEGNNARVVQLLQAGAIVNETSNNRGENPELPRSALTAAARWGHMDVVKTLLDAGAPVDQVVGGDETPLIAATRRNHLDVSNYLIERGADVNLAVQGDGSPLIAATMANNPRAVRLLLQNGADANLAVRGDENPLYHASIRGNDEIIQMLIDAGVDLNQEWRGDGTALIVAARAGNTAGATADLGVSGDGTAMIVAARRGDTELLQKMIATGADVNASVNGDGNPLIQAATNGHMDSVATLLQAGANIDLVVAGDENALIGAARQGDVEMVDYLLRSGANPNTKAESYGKTRTALSQAMLAGHDDVIRMLRAVGAIE